MLPLRHLDEKKHKHSRNQIYYKLLDFVVYFISIVGPVFTIPQIYLIWQDKSAVGVSLTTWLSYFLFSVVWLLYGIAHKAKPIIFSNMLWIIIDGLVVFGVLIYGTH